MALVQETDALTEKMKILLSNREKSVDAKQFHWTIRNEKKDKILKELPNADLKVTDLRGNTVLHLILTNKKLAKNEIIEFLEMFLDEGVDINAENKQGQTVLHRAIQYRMIAVINLLVRRKADLNKRDSKGNLITHNFIEDESEWFYELMKRFKSRFHMTDRVQMKDESVIFLFMTINSDRKSQESESARFTEFLIEEGFNFDLQNKNGTSALHLAIERNLYHIVHVLVKHTRNIHFIHHQSKFLLHLFIEKKAAFRYKLKRRDWYREYASRYVEDIVKTLLDRCPPISQHDCLIQTALECEEDLNIIQILVDHRLKSCESGSATDVFLELTKGCAWWGDDTPRTKYFSALLSDLLIRGVNVNAKDTSGFTALYHAFHAKNVRAANLFNALGADFGAVTICHENLFHGLARSRTPYRATSDECLEFLFKMALSRGCRDVNARNSSAETPLHLAAKSGFLAIVRNLFEYGAEVNVEDEDGKTPLQLAMKSERAMELVEFLLENGANVNAKDRWGRRPLSLAVEAPHANELVPMLLKRGAYVNAYNDMELPFWKAILNGNYGVAEEMLAYGADINNYSHAVCSLLESSCSYVSRWRDSESLMNKELLLRHWIKLSAARMLCSKEYGVHTKTDECQMFYEDCLKEIEKLKVTFIDACTSIYSFLGMDFNCRRSHMNNDKLRQLVESPELEEHFPNYSVVIRASYHESVLWKFLLEPAKRAWLQITGIRLPSECLDSIFAHLRNQDLLNMIDYDN